MLVSNQLNRSLLLLLLVLLLFSSPYINGFSIGRPSTPWQRLASTSSSIVLHEQQKDDENTDPDMNPLTKSSWYAVEAFGKVFGNNKKNKDKKTQSDGLAEEEYDFSQPPQSLKETLERIKLDNDRAYFLSGQVDEEVYDENCVFRDPFVSFEGRQRFVENLANLGSFITNYSAKVLNYNDEDPTMVQTKVSSLASLPKNRHIRL